MNGTSIRSKLVTYFVTVIAALLVVNVVFIIFHILIVKEYENIAKNIFLQYRVIEATSALISEYNTYRNDPTEKNLEHYLAVKNELSSIFTTLNKTVTNKESRNELKSVQNTVLSVLEETDHGIENIQRGDTLNTSLQYTEANRKFVYVEENSASLILKQVEYSAEISAKVSASHQLMMIFGGMLILAVVGLSLIASWVWSNRLVDPLKRLSSLAEIIAKGNLDVGVDHTLTEIQDEVGSLSRSFNSMIQSLRESVHGMQVSNEKVMKAKEELEELNKHFIDREMKMVELKKRIVELEKEAKNPITKE
jgi:two-component system, sensor histidine kinase YesM